jgi:hypothetical protein
MSKLKRELAFLIFFIVLVGPTAAQGQSELDQLFDKIKGVVQETEPGWTCERGEPFGAPTKPPYLLVMGCSLHTQAPLTRHATHTVILRHVSIRVAPHRSADEARRLLRNSVSERPNEFQGIKDLPDEAYGWGMDHADIVLVRGRFIVYLSASPHVGYDTDAKTLTREQKDEREKSERLRLAPQFAKHVLAILDSF